MNVFALVGLLVAICCFTLAIFVFIIRKNRLHRTWAAFNTIVGLWSLGTFFAAISKTPTQAILSWKFTYLPCTFISIGYYHLICVFCGLNRKKSLIYIQGIIFLFIIAFTDLFVKSSIYIFNSIHYHKATFTFTFWLLIWGIITYSAFLELFRFIKKARESDKTQSLYLFWGMLLGFIGGTSTVLPSYGVMIYPIWQFSICIYFVIMTYAILKHQLMDINIVIKKGLVYSILITIFTIIYLSIVILTERIFQGIMGYHSLLISILSASIIALIFTPLKNKVQSFIDKIFLGRTTAQIAKENELLRQELERSERLKAVGTFASGMTHEIKNYLTAIKIFTAYLPQKIEDKEFLAKFSKVVSSEVEKMDSLVHQLLDFSKPSPPNLKETDIHKLIDATLELLSNQFINYRITINKDFSELELITKIDANQIRQVFLNLFLNAVDAMPEGGTITLSTSIRENSRSQKLAEISVKDTGNGIPEKDLPHIFEPFYSTKKEGTGLGLSIIYNIIKEHHGTISVTSKLGEGTTFTISLPVAR